MKNESSKTSGNNHNLAILAVGAVLITCLTTGISLYLYHESGDIYLDRSRPGFLPDKTEVEEEDHNKNDNYTFPDEGKIDTAVLEEYLQEFDKKSQTVLNSDDLFSATPLSDESLGIKITPVEPAPEPSEPATE